ncbi:hypothetical protein ALC57_05476, partial [Trachymyrmex cornetzi]
SIYLFVDEFKIACCKLLSALCLEESGQRFFLKSKGSQTILAFITDTYSVSIRNITLQSMQVISTDLTVAKSFVENKYLFTLNNRLSSKTIPLWDTFIEILKSHLPTKFALTGRLFSHDLTQDGFYVLKTNICSSLMTDDIFRIKICPLEPIYVVNYLELFKRMLSVKEPKDVIQRQKEIQIEITMEDSNEGRLFDDRLDGNNEDYEKIRINYDRIIRQVKSRTNSVKILANNTETMTETLEEALAPLMTIGVYCNLGMFEYPIGQPRTYISCLYALTKWSLLMYFFYYPRYIDFQISKTVYTKDIVPLVTITLILINIRHFKVKI